MTFNPVAPEALAGGAPSQGGAGAENKGPKNIPVRIYVHEYPCAASEKPSLLGTQLVPDPYIYVEITYGNDKFEMKIFDNEKINEFNNIIEDMQQSDMHPCDDCDEDPTILKHLRFTCDIITEYEFLLKREDAEEYFIQLKKLAEVEA